MHSIPKDLFNDTIDVRKFWPIFKCRQLPSPYHFIYLCLGFLCYFTMKHQQENECLQGGDSLVTNIVSDNAQVMKWDSADRFHAG